MGAENARRTALALCALTMILTPLVTAAPVTESEMEVYNETGCYYNFHHYGEGDRIVTNEPCLNCTCHNRMLMCYLRVCPFTKLIGQDCNVVNRAGDCCPVIECPDVPVDTMSATTSSSVDSTEVGHHDNYGCTIDDKFYADGARVPSVAEKPCELCYCIRNMTACVMQECTLHIEGCTPVYHKGVCCPVRYSCDHPEDEGPMELDDMTTTVRPTPGFILTTTMIPDNPKNCTFNGEYYADGAQIQTEQACEHCYCMKGDMVCAVQECGDAMEHEGKNCTAIPPEEGQCCTQGYICEGDETTTEVGGLSTMRPSKDEATPSEDVEKDTIRPVVDEKEPEQPVQTDRPEEDKGTESPVEEQQQGTESPVEEQQQGTESPVEEQQQGTESPVEEQQQGTERPVEEQQKETERPVEEPEKEAQRPEKDEEKSTERPEDQEKETEGPLVEQEKGTERPEDQEKETEGPLVEQEKGTERPEDQEKETESPLLEQEKGTERPEDQEKETERPVEEHQKETKRPEDEYQKETDRPVATTIQPEADEQKTSRPEYDDEKQTTHEDQSHEQTTAHPKYEHDVTHPDEDQEKETAFPEQDQEKEKYPEQDQEKVTISGEKLHTEPEESTHKDEVEATTPSIGDVVTKVKAVKGDDKTSEIEPTDEATEKMPEHDHTQDEKLTTIAHDLESHDKITTPVRDEDKSATTPSVPEELRTTFAHSEPHEPTEDDTITESSQYGSGDVPLDSDEQIKEEVTPAHKDDFIPAQKPDQERETTEYPEDHATTPKGTTKDIDQKPEYYSTQVPSKETEESITDFSVHPLPGVHDHTEHSHDEETEKESITDAPAVPTEKADDVITTPSSGTVSDMIEDNTVVPQTVKDISKEKEPEKHEPELDGEFITTTPRVEKEKPEEEIPGEFESSGDKPSDEDEEKHTTPVKTLPDKDRKDTTQEVDEGPHTTPSVATEVPGKVHDDSTPVEQSTESIEHTATGKPEHPSHEIEPVEKLPTTAKADQESEVTTEKEDHAESVATHQPEVTDKIEEATQPATTEKDEHYEEPSRIPGEGDCLVDGITYRHNSNVPTMHKCQMSCSCANSILKCERVECPPPPPNYKNCQPVHHNREACCPTYMCEHQEPVTIESGSQVFDSHTTVPESTEQSATVKDYDIQTEQPTIAPVKHDEFTTPESTATEAHTTERMSTIAIEYLPDCGPGGCFKDTTKPGQEISTTTDEVDQFSQYTTVSDHRDEPEQEITLRPVVDERVTEIPTTKGVPKEGSTYAPTTRSEDQPESTKKPDERPSTVKSDSEQPIDEDVDQIFDGHSTSVPGEETDITKDDSDVPLATRLDSEKDITTQQIDEVTESHKHVTEEPKLPEQELETTPAARTTIVPEAETPVDDQKEEHQTEGKPMGEIPTTAKYDDDTATTAQHAGEPQFTTHPEKSITEGPEKSETDEVTPVEEEIHTTVPIEVVTDKHHEHTTVEQEQQTEKIEKSTEKPIVDISRITTQSPSIETTTLPFDDVNKIGVSVLPSDLVDEDCGLQGCAPKVPEDCGPQGCAPKIPEDCGPQGCAPKVSEECGPHGCTSKTPEDCGPQGCVLKTPEECGPQGCAPKVSEECGPQGCTPKTPEDCGLEGCTPKTPEDCGPQGCAPKIPEECGPKGCATKELEDCGPQGCATRKPEDCGPEGCAPKTPEDCGPQGCGAKPEDKPSSTEKVKAPSDKAPCVNGDCQEDDQDNAIDLDCDNGDCEYKPQKPSDCGESGCEEQKTTIPIEITTQSEIRATEPSTEKISDITEHPPYQDNEVESEPCGPAGCGEGQLPETKKPEVSDIECDGEKCVQVTRKPVESEIKPCDSPACAGQDISEQTPTTIVPEKATTVSTPTQKLDEPKSTDVPEKYDCSGDDCDEATVVQCKDDKCSNVPLPEGDIEKPIEKTSIKPLCSVEGGCEIQPSTEKGISISEDASTSPDEIVTTPVPKAEDEIPAHQITTEHAELETEIVTESEKEQLKTTLSEDYSTEAHTKADLEVTDRPEHADHETKRPDKIDTSTEKHIDLATEVPEDITTLPSAHEKLEEPHEDYVPEQVTEADLKTKVPEAPVDEEKPTEIYPSKDHDEVTETGTESYDKEGTKSPISHEEPEKTERPDIVSEPEKTERPDIVSEPEKTDRPDIVSETKKTERPDIGSESEKTERPEIVSEPEKTERPDIVSEPETTDKPDIVSEPETTDKPDIVSEPETTDKPDIVSEPEKTERPDIVSEPETTDKPDIVSEPETTDKPDFVSEPEATDKPDFVSEPETTDKPDIVYEPETTDKPDIISEPEKATPVEIVTSKPEYEKETTRPSDERSTEHPVSGIEHDVTEHVPVTERDHTEPHEETTDREVSEPAEQVTEAELETKRPESDETPESVETKQPAKEPTTERYIPETDKEETQAPQVHLDDKTKPDEVEEATEKRITEPYSDDKTEAPLVEPEESHTRPLDSEKESPLPEQVTESEIGKKTTQPEHAIEDDKPTEKYPAEDEVETTDSATVSDDIVTTKKPEGEPEVTDKPHIVSEPVATDRPISEPEKAIPVDITTEKPEDERESTKSDERITEHSVEQDFTEAPSVTEKELVEEHTTPPKDTTQHDTYDKFEPITESEKEVVKTDLPEVSETEPEHEKTTERYIPEKTKKPVLEIEQQPKPVDDETPVHDLTTESITTEVPEHVTHEVITMGEDDKSQLPAVESDDHVKVETEIPDLDKVTIPEGVTEPSIAIETTKIPSGDITIGIKQETEVTDSEKKVTVTEKYVTEPYEQKTDAVPTEGPAIKLETKVPYVDDSVKPDHVTEKDLVDKTEKPYSEKDEISKSTEKSPTTVSDESLETDTDHYDAKTTILPKDHEEETKKPQEGVTESAKTTYSDRGTEAPEIEKDITKLPVEQITEHEKPEIEQDITEQPSATDKLPETPSEHADEQIPVTEKATDHVPPESDEQVTEIGKEPVTSKSTTEDHVKSGEVTTERVEPEIPEVTVSVIDDYEKDKTKAPEEYTKAEIEPQTEKYDKTTEPHTMPVDDSERTTLPSEVGYDKPSQEKTTERIAPGVTDVLEVEKETEVPAHEVDTVTEKRITELYYDDKTVPSQTVSSDIESETKPPHAETESMQPEQITESVLKTKATEKPIDEGKPTEVYPSKDHDEVTETGTESYDKEGTKSPISHEEPEKTERPDIVSEPEKTERPDIVSEPETTDKPDIVSEPETTDKPDFVSEPETTDKPDIVYEPETTDKPDIISEPEKATPVEIVTSKPEYEKETTRPSDERSTEHPVSGIEHDVTEHVPVTERDHTEPHEETTDREVSEPAEQMTEAELETKRPESDETPESVETKQPAKEPTTERYIPETDKEETQAPQVHLDDKTKPDEVEEATEKRITEPYSDDKTEAPLEPEESHTEPSEAGKETVPPHVETETSQPDHPTEPSTGVKTEKPEDQPEEPEEPEASGHTKEQEQPATVTESIKTEKTTQIPEKHDEITERPTTAVYEPEEDDFSQQQQQQQTDDFGPPSDHVKNATRPPVHYTTESPFTFGSHEPSEETEKPDYPTTGHDEHLPQSPDFPGSYGQPGADDDYDETPFGPGTCRYAGKVYVSAQQIPRDDPCDFCFCFRSDIICLQQSCPPPIQHCHEEPIQGFCCPRYECPVSMATVVNMTTTTTTTTTTLPPHFLSHAYKGAARRQGCQIQGKAYKVGEAVKSASGPCMHCTCGGDGQMKCEPKVCTPEPMLRQMIAAVATSRRR